MKITVDIDDQHYDEFMELLKTLDYARASQEYEIPQWQQDIVMECAAKIDSGEMELHDIDDVMKRVFDDK
ncbi:MAG: hypothetical protein GC178_17135 [Flavobacteriales bacterium]|nr:hypothetical protein [Flavobacteriales bacterium]